MQISHERLYFQASNQPQHSFKRLHQGFKNVRSVYESHISRPQPHDLKQAAAVNDSEVLFQKEVRGASRAGPEEGQGFRGSKNTKTLTKTCGGRVPYKIRTRSRRPSTINHFVVQRPTSMIRAAP